MGWHIDLVKNTVKINSQTALALYNCKADVCFSWEEECTFPILQGIIYDGALVFNPDHMEHMDYLWQPEVLEVLKRFKVKGDICFASHQGDNKGQKWGYRFDGEGNMVKLVGKKTSWSEVDVPRQKAKKIPSKDRQLLDVKNVIVSEGFDYGLRHYSSFREVKDAKFHKLLKAYREAADALEAYIGE